MYSTEGTIERFPISSFLSFFFFYKIIDGIDSNVIELKVRALVCDAIVQGRHHLDYLFQKLKSYVSEGGRSTAMET